MPGMTAAIGELEHELEVSGKQHARVVQLAGQFSQEELTRLCYQHFAAAYDKHMEETGHYHALRWALERCKELIEPGTLLDVSCGTGEALLYLAEHLKERERDRRYRQRSLPGNAGDCPAEAEKQ